MTRDEKYRATQAKNRAYQTRRALRLIRKGQPKTLLETHELGLRCVHAGAGAFRTAYRIHGTDLLIKFPLRYRCETDRGPEVWEDEDGKIHARMEMKKIQALEKFPIMRKHIPHVYYFHSKDGVTVTRHYPKSKLKNVHSATNRLLSEMIKEYCDVILGDLTPDNLREISYDNLIILDLGY